MVATIPCINKGQNSWSLPPEEHSLSRQQSDEKIISKLKLLL